MPNTFTLEELTNAEKPFRATAIETPPVEPETTPAESPTAEVPDGDVVVAAESTPADAADDSAPVSTDEAPQKGSARERIEELVADKNALKKYIEYRESLWSQPPAGAPAVATSAVTTPVSEAAPTLESCQYDTDKWTQAMNVWTQKQIQAGVKQALNAEKQSSTIETQKAQFEERMETFAKSTPDAKVVLGNPALPQLAPEAAALIVASDIGPQILYYLGKNPEKAARIARQSAIQQAEAIGRISAEVKTTKVPQKQLSNAPPPPTPTKGAAAPTEPKTLKDFVMAERKAMAERRRRH